MSIKAQVLAVIQKLKSGMQALLAMLKLGGKKATPVQPSQPTVNMKPTPVLPPKPTVAPPAPKPAKPTYSFKPKPLAPVLLPKPAPKPVVQPPAPLAPILTLRDMAGVNDPITASAAKELGIGSVRLTGALWPTVQPSSATLWNWGPADSEVNAALAAGLDPLLILGYTPPWAQANPKADQVSLPNSTADFTAYVDAVCARYAGKVKYYQIWNEPEPGAFLDGTIQQYFDQILVPASPVVRSHGGLVVLGGWPCNQWLSDGPGTPKPMPPLPESGLYGILLEQPSVREAIDILDLHYQSSWAFEAVYRDWVSPATEIQKLGITPFKGVWMTEFGYVVNAAGSDFASLLSWAEQTGVTEPGSVRWFWYGEGLSALTTPDGALTATGKGLAALNT